MTSRIIVAIILNQSFLFTNRGIAIKKSSAFVSRGRDKSRGTTSICRPLTRCRPFRVTLLSVCCYGHTRRSLLRKSVRCGALEMYSLCVSVSVLHHPTALLKLPRRYLFSVIAFNEGIIAQLWRLVKNFLWNYFAVFLISIYR